MFWAGWALLALVLLIAIWSIEMWVSGDSGCVGWWRLLVCSVTIISSCTCLGVMFPPSSDQEEYKAPNRRNHTARFRDSDSNVVYLDPEMDLVLNRCRDRNHRSHYRMNALYTEIEKLEGDVHRSEVLLGWKETVNTIKADVVGASGWTVASIGIFIGVMILWVLQLKKIRAKKTEKRDTSWAMW